MHIERIGQGPDLVLLHGWGLHSGVFEPLRQPLARQYRLHLVDLPGFGKSRADHLPTTTAGLVDSLLEEIPTGACWLGWSLGAQIALLAAQRAPGRVRCLILVAGTPCFVTRDDWPTAMSPEVFQGFADGLRMDWRGALARFIGLLAADPRRDRELLRSLRDRLFVDGEPSPEALARGLEWLRDNDLRPGLPTMRVPALVVQGERDRLVPPGVAAAMASLSPSVQTVMIEGAGHAPFVSHSADFLSCLETFLAEAA